VSQYGPPPIIGPTHVPNPIINRLNGVNLTTLFKKNVIASIKVTSCPSGLLCMSEKVEVKPWTKKRREAAKAVPVIKQNPRDCRMLKTS
jgi:hypothetical protein